MPALLCQAEKPAFRHLRQMPAGSLRGHAGGVGELRRRKGAAVEQRHQHIGAGRVPYEGGDLGERWLDCLHPGEDRLGSRGCHRATLRN